MNSKDGESGCEGMHGMEHGKHEMHEEHEGHKGTAHMGHGGPGGGDHHAHMVADFRKRFWVSLIVTIPILFLSPMIQSFLGLRRANPRPRIWRTGPPSG